MSKSNDLSVDSANCELPVIYDVAWNITQAQVDTVTPTFGAIQAFFDSSLTVVPQLVIDSGKTIDGVPYQSLIRFAYSGEKHYFKGAIIRATGIDRFGNAITSTPIGSTLTTDITYVQCFGGAGGN